MKKLFACLLIAVFGILPALSQTPPQQQVSGPFGSTQVNASTVFNAQRVFAAMVRPANTTAYALGQLVGNSTTAGSVVPIPLVAGRYPGDTGIVQRVKLSKTSLTLTNAQFRVHLYRSAPTPANGDGGAWSTSSSIYLGSFDVTMDKAFTDEANGFGVPNVGTQVAFDTGTGQNFYALIEARAAYTPASGETFMVTAEVVH